MWVGDTKQGGRTNYNTSFRHISDCSGDDSSGESEVECFLLGSLSSGGDDEGWIRGNR